MKALSAADALNRLTGLSQELAGAFRPVSIVEIVARTLTEVLAPGRLSVMLLDVDTNRLSVTYHNGPRPATTDEPLLQLALRRGPLVFPDRVAARAAELGVTVDRPAPASWLGIPIVAVSRAIGAVAMEGDRSNALDESALLFTRAVLAQAGIALENARLVELLSSGKREWEQTVDAFNQAICYVDSQGLVRRANRVFAELIKLPVTALPGRPWLTLLPPTWADPVSRALGSGAVEGAAPVEVRAGDRILLVTAIPTGEPGAAVLLFEDQTEKRRLQEQLVQSEKMSAIGQLIAGVAHDLNNPLASVVGFSDLLGEAADVPPRLAEPLAVIRQEAERASAIVRNLLSFARRQEGERQLQSIRPILESTHQLLKNQLMAARIELTLEFEPGLPAVEVHANQIKQVFVNIINNAAQAIASTRARQGGGRIEIVTRCEPDGLSVNISDNGPGIPEDIAQRVFEPFFSTKSEGEGTGLGLSICLGIVKEHGGSIRVDPGGGNTGRGATFTVELPTGARSELNPRVITGVDRPEPTTTAEPPAPAAPERLQRLRVLVVDDEPHILHYMQATLESWGHEVDVARDGSQALKRALMQPFDLIICDLRMPRLGGREMFQTLSRMHPTVAERIIFATGDTVRGDTLQFLEELGRPFLQKPFKLDALRRVLAGVVKVPA
ncbi:MAG TPA: ATP-binding protein [Gemmatimonadales bacterium]|nr:ATP-binding protein [Gemmatimonadales bacterium]